MLLFYFLNSYCIFRHRIVDYSKNLFDTNTMNFIIDIIYKTQANGGAAAFHSS